MLVHSEIFASIMVVVELSRTTENQSCLEMPENIICLALAMHCPAPVPLVPKRNMRYLLGDEFEPESSAGIEQEF